MGSGLNAERVRDISLARPREVVIALDEDATGNAFAIAKKWGMAWNRTRVAILEKDIKDTPASEQAEAIGV